MKRLMFVIVALLAATAAAEEFSDVVVPEQLIPQRVIRRYRYESPYICDNGDSVQLVIRFKKSGGAWAVRELKTYSPQHQIADGKALSLVLEARMMLGNEE